MFEQFLEIIRNAFGMEWNGIGMKCHEMKNLYYLVEQVQPMQQVQQEQEQLLK